MKYSNQIIINRLDSGENIKYLFFWGHTKTERITKTCFSQWYESKFVVDGVEFNTAEQWMMAQKALLFDNQEIYQQILISTKPGKIKELGRQVKSFNQKVWEEKRFDIVVKGNFYKFSQNSTLQIFLKNTKDRVIVEASPVDTIWGIGLSQNNENATNPYKWKGQNLLGYALMEVRDLL